MIAFRIQDKNRGVEYLLDPETQYSWPMDYDESKVRHGVSPLCSLSRTSLHACMMT
jgi:hypothetical protein